MGPGEGCQVRSPYQEAYVICEIDTLGAGDGWEAPGEEKRGGGGGSHKMTRERGATGLHCNS